MLTNPRNEIYKKNDSPILLTFMRSGLNIVCEGGQWEKKV